MTRFNAVVLGASYGSLLASKLLVAGHDVKLVCLASEAELINASGTRVRMPVRGRPDLVEIDSRALPGRLSADVPEAVDPREHDLVVLAMQEPQYGVDGVRELLAAIAEARVPSMSIMNMPPLPYLARLPGIDAQACVESYTAPAVWDSVDPELITLCSPDPQAFRPPEEPDNVLQVGLPTNFKAARFSADDPTAMLRRMEADIDAARFPTEDGEIELPVKLRVHDSLYVPLAKWSMLIAGNYRCIRSDGVCPIKETVHGNLDASRAVYDWVVDVCKAMGAAEQDLVPFDKYAHAAESLLSPSSVARAVDGGARQVERVDRLVQMLAAQQGMRSEVLDEIVALVDAKLEANRAVAA